MTSLTDRVSSRGFPSVVADGMTGAGAAASQGGSQDPAHGESTATGTTTQVLAGFEAEGPAATDAGVILEGTWGLPGSLEDPDRTPRSHAAPVPGWAGSYCDADAISVLHENSQLIHGQDFGALAGHMDTPPDGGTELPMNPWEVNDPGETVLQPQSGQIRSMGGRDRVQGYNLSNRYGFDAPHRNRLQITGNVINTYLDPAERPLIVPQPSGSFTPDDAVQGPEPWNAMRSMDQVNTDPPSAYQGPPEPETMTVPIQGAPAASGWWA